MYDELKSMLFLEVGLACQTGPDGS